MQNKVWQREIEHATRIIPRPLTSPLLAFFAFGVSPAMQSAL